MRLRDYQQRAIDGLFEYFHYNSGNPLIIAPTGAGKSVIIGGLCHRILTTWPNQRIMVLSHVKELLQQNLEKVHAFWPSAPTGLYCAALKRRDTRQPITVASIQSVYRKPHVFGWRDLVLIDECHLLAPDSDSMYRSFIAGLMETNPHLKVVGLTATAYRLKTGMLHEGDGSLFTDVAVEISLTELLEAGHVCPLVSKSSVTQADLSSVRVTGGEFNSRDAEAAMDKETLTQATLDEVFALAGERKSWLFFCSGVDHAEHVAEALRERGVVAASVSGDTPAAERDQILAEFKAGQVRAVTNANVLTTGFDNPDIDLLVLLRPTTSPGLYTQILGRGMRTAPGKQNCLVLDYAGNIERHGPVTHVKPPRAANSRGPRETNPRSCLICPACRMASPLGSLECAECGHSFAPPERVNHDTTASDLDVMGKPEIAAEWLPVKWVTYHKHLKPNSPPTLRVEYDCGIKVHKEWICLEHPQGFARGKAVDWWKRRTSVRVPDTIDEALLHADNLKRPFKIRVEPDERWHRVTGWDLTGAMVNESDLLTGDGWKAVELPADEEEPIPF